MKAIRDSFRQSSKKLRRARKLYGFLCSKLINKHAQAAIPLAIRAKEFGLYSENTGVDHVIFSLCRYAYKHSSYRSGNFSDWHKWIRNHDTEIDNRPIWHGVKRLPKKGNKPHIKLSVY